MGFVESFDHFVLPVDDIVAAEEFYTRVFGGPIEKRNGLDVAQRKRGAVPHTFFQIAGKRMGVFLQSDERAPSDGVRGAPTFSFETTRRGLDATWGELRSWGAAHQDPVERDRPFAAASLYFADPAGNHYHVYVPGGDVEDTPGGSRMRSVGYLELEAPRIEASVGWYEQVLGFELASYGRDPTQEARQATMRLPSGQLLFLTEVPFAFKGVTLSRTIPGPHLGFRIPAQSWRAALDRLQELGIPNGDRGASKVRQPGEGGTYMDDPAGYVIQYITDGMQ